MKGQEQVFGVCQHCRGALQFEAAMAGQTAACPNCGQPTRLTPGKLSSKSNMALWLGLLLACAIGIAAGLSFLANKSAPTQKMKAEGTHISATATFNSNEEPSKAAPVEQKAPELTSINGFDVSKATLEKASNSRLIYAVGLVRNPLGQQRFGVRIELNLIDGDGNQVGTATDYANVIEPKGDWKFRALVTDPKAASAEVAAVKENF